VTVADPVVTWWMQGWWGAWHNNSGSDCVPSAANQQCHCEKLPGALAFSAQQIRLPPFVKELNAATANCNNALSMLQPDNVTVIQTQPALRCKPNGPLLVTPLYHLSFPLRSAVFTLLQFMHYQTLTMHRRAAPIHNRAL
jgi:hypothetical protein